MGKRLGLPLSDGRMLDKHTQVMMSAGTSSAELAAAIAADPDVEWVEVDHRRFVQTAPVNDPLYVGGQTTSVATTGRPPASGTCAPRTGHHGQVVSSINIEPAWAITHGSSSIAVADVDTGITMHPDLDSKVLTGYDFISWGVSTTSTPSAWRTPRTRWPRPMTATWRMPIRRIRATG